MGGLPYLSNFIDMHALESSWLNYFFDYFENWGELLAHFCFFAFF